VFRPIKGVVQRQIDISAKNVPSLNDVKQVENVGKGLVSHIHSFHKACGYTLEGSLQMQMILFQRVPGFQ